MKTTERIFLVVVFLILYLLFEDSTIHYGYVNRFASLFPRKVNLLLQYLYPLIEKIWLGLSIFHFLVLVVKYRKQSSIQQSVNALKGTNQMKDAVEVLNQDSNSSEIFNENLKSDFKQTLKFWGLLFVPIVVFWILYLLIGKGKQKKSLKHNYDSKIEQLKIVHSEPVFEDVEYWLKMSDTKGAGTGYVSKTVKDFLENENTPDFEPMRISSKYELADHLYLRRDMELEEKFLKNWAKSANSGYRYFSYLEANYFNHYEYFLNAKQYNRLRWYSESFLRRLYLYDTTHNSDEDLDEMILFSFIYNDKNLIKANQNELKLLKETISNLFQGNIDNVEFNSIIINHKPFKEVLRYLFGVKNFRNENYKQAYSIFEEIYKKTKNIHLKNYSSLLMGRCVFWDFERQANNISNNTEDAISILKSIKDDIDVVSLKSDIDEYIGILEFNQDTSDETIY